MVSKYAAPQFSNESDRFLEKTLFCTWIDLEEKMTYMIDAKGLRKQYGEFTAVNNLIYKVGDSKL